MRDLKRVFHVGDIDENRPARFRAAGDSQEGNGLSISVHPSAWTKIARLGGHSTYALEKENPKFFDALDKSLRKEALKWCLEMGFIEKTTVFRSYFSDEDGKKVFFEFKSEAEALESGEELKKLKKVSGYVVGEAKFPYFEEDFEPSSIHTVDYAVIWYAENAGYDGVWWEETFSPNSFSAPRGVIFQGKLEEWTIVRGQSEDEDSD